MLFQPTPKKYIDASLPHPSAPKPGAPGTPAPLGMTHRWLLATSPANC